MKIKFKVALIALSMALLSVGFAVKAETTDNSALIAQLQAMISSLMQQIVALQAQQGSSTSTSSINSSSEWCHTFNDYLYLGSVNQSTDGDVANLATALGSEHILLNEGTRFTFNEDMKAGVIQFQAKYGITQTGTLGPITRAKLNSLYGCSTASTTSSTTTATTNTTTNVTPYIKITSSPSGSILEDSDITITWTSQGTIKKLGVEFCPSGSAVESSGCTEIRSITNTGSVDLNIGDVFNLAVGKWYPVLLDSSDTSVYSKGSTFTVISSTCTKNSDCSLLSDVASKCVNGKCTPNVTQNFSINGQSSNGPVSVSNGSVATLTWTSQNSTSCVASSCNVTSSLPITGTCPAGNSADSLWSGSISTSGTKTSSAITQPIVYSLICTGTNGTTANNSLGVQPSTVTQPTITVTSPTSGSTWTVGNVYTIKWNSFTGNNSNIYIYLSGGGHDEGYSKIIATTINGSTSKSYTPTTNDLPATSGSTWSVFVCDGSMNSGATNCGYSGSLNIIVSTTTSTNCTGPTKDTINYYTKTTTSNSKGDSITDYCVSGYSSYNLMKGYCTSNGTVANTSYLCQYGCSNGACLKQSDIVPAISITSPSGGETWKVGETYDIAWTSTGVDKVNIVTGDFASTQIKMNYSASNGIYSWTIPSTVASGTYAITLYDVDNAASVVATSKKITISQ